MLGLRLLEAKRPPESVVALREAVGLLNAPADLLERRETEATLGWALNTAGDFKGGVTVLQDALRLGDEQRATQPVMVNILKLLVWGARASGDHAAAVKALERLRDIGEKGDSTVDLGDTYEGLAVERLLMKSAAPAIADARKAVAVRVNAKPVVLAGSYQVLGWALDTTDASPEAIQALKKSIELRRQAGLAASENLEALLLLANAARKAGDVETSLTARREVIQIARDKGDNAALAEGLDELGLAALLLQRPQIAIPPLTEAVALRRKSGASVAFGRSLHLLGWALTGSGRKDDAVGTYNEAAEIRRQVGDTREVQLESLRALGYLLWELKRGNEAIPPFERALALVRKEPTDALSEAAAQTDLSVAYLIGSIPDKALEPAQTAIDLYERNNKKGEPLAAALYAYGWALFSNSRQKEAVDPFRRSLAIREAAGSEKVEETRSFLQAAIESSGPGA
jgi:tetratricopeptide (TPR) repeat protein